MEVNAVGGAAYELVKQGTVPYANDIESVVVGKKLATSTYISCGVERHPRRTWVIDEQHNNVNYAADLLEWITDYNTDILRIIEQTQAILIIHPRSFPSGTTFRTRPTIFRIVSLTALGQTRA